MMYGIGFFVLLIDITVRGNKLQDARAALERDLLQDYNSYVIPRAINGGPLVVNHSLSVINVHSLEDNVLTLQGWVDTAWYDSRLKWDPALYGEIKRVVIPINKLWKPDVFLFNSAREFTGHHYGDIHAVVFSDGAVMFSPPLYSKSVCAFEEKDLYTNNYVVCELQFISWMYDGYHLDFNVLKDGVDINYISPKSSRKWKIADSAAERIVNYYDNSPSPYISAQYDLTFQRIS